MRGRKPSCPFSINGPKPLEKVPAAPKAFNAEQKKCWRDVASQLIESRILSALDLHLLQRLVELTFVADTAMSLLQAEGIIVEGQQNPALIAHRNATAQLQKIYGDLGMNPCSRSRLRFGDNGEAVAIAEIEASLRYVPVEPPPKPVEPPPAPAPPPPPAPPAPAPPADPKIFSRGCVVIG